MDLFILIARKIFAFISFKSLAIPFGVFVAMLSTYMHDIMEPIETKRKPTPARETRIKVIFVALVALIVFILLENLNFKSALLKFGIYALIGCFLGFFFDEILKWLYNKDNLILIFRCIWVFIKILITVWASGTKSAFVEALNEAKDKWEIEAKKKKRK